MKSRNRCSAESVSLFAAAWLLSLPGTLAAFSAEKAPFSVRVKGETIPYRVFALFVMPDEELDLERVGRQGRLEVTADTGEASKTAAGRWSWQAPGAPGLSTLEVRDPENGSGIRLNVFVLVPATEVEKEHLNGYRIGAYPREPFRGLAVYRPPTGFVEVNEDNRKTPLSPHFTLEQFLCKQAGGYPKYVVLRERLLLKLEYLLALVNEKGYRAETFAVLSGYRTPFYNRAIGNVRYSRHQWGGAADVFVDETPRDGRMDDLDGNGRSDIDDARLLYRLFEGAAGAPEHRELTGGLGVYGTTSTHGPFVHVDARGYRARWGKI